MQYNIAPLFCRPWTLNGISPRLIESHYEHIYGEAINRLNGITRELEALDAAAPAEVINRLKRDQFTELNSTLLHELYFASLGGDGRALPEGIAGAIARDFGSVDRWRHEFIALATALSGSAGWVLLTYVPRDGRLINQTASDHGQSIAGGIPILAIDMYEHAYQLEFGANAKAYIAAFMRNIEWNAAQVRYDDASKVRPPRPLEQTQFADLPSISAEEVKAMLDSGSPCRSSTRVRDIIQREHRTSWRERSGAIRNGCMSGSANFQRPSRSLRSAFTGSTSDASRRQRCARPALTLDTWPAATTRGRPSTVRSGYSSRAVHLLRGNVSTWASGLRKAGR